MLGFVQKPFFLELEFILSKIFVPLVRDFQMFQKLTNRLPFCFVLRHPHSMRTFATFISVGIARIADRGSRIAALGSRIVDRGSQKSKLYKQGKKYSVLSNPGRILEGFKF